jgi:hypothetical protein
MMSHFPLQQHGFDGQTYPTPGSLCGRGRPRLPSKGFSRMNKIKEKKFISTASLSMTTIAHPPLAMIAKTAFIAVDGPP